LNSIIIKELGEYNPQKQFNSITLNKLKEFITVPYYINWYRSSESNKIFPIYAQGISDLNTTKFQVPGILTRNPFFDHAQAKYFIAYSNGAPVGRIMAHIDYNYIKKEESNIGWFGLFESIDDKNIAEMLIEKAMDYLKQNGCQRIIGPAIFNAAGEIGLLIKGFEYKPYFMEPYNAPYYQDFFINFGFEKENDWYSMNTDELLADGYMERIEKVINKMQGTNRDLASSGFKIRNASIKNMKSEIKIIKDLYNEIWNTGNHPQQVVVTDKEFDILAAGISSIAIEDLIFILEKDGIPVGVSVSIPDINEVIAEYDKNNPSVPSKSFFNLKDFKRDIKIFNLIQKKVKQKNFLGLRILILGIKEECRKTGIDSMFYYQTFKVGKELGFKHGSGSQLADINTDILNPTFKIGKKAFTWRVYGLDL
jgi:hypothetical protein